MNKRVSTAFIDCLLLLLLVLIILPHEPAPRAKQNVDLYSELIIGARWADKSPSDIDLWVRAPGDLPVGYSRTRGNSASLVWDDVGQVQDPIWRFEAAMIRSARDGEYVVNLHGYSLKVSHPVPVEIVVWRNLPASGMKQLWSGKVEIAYQGQELTVVRFNMINGEILPGSFHKQPIKIRSGRNGSSRNR